MNNYGLALKYAQEAVEIEKSDIDKDLYELLGRSYHRVGDLDSAIINYSRAISKLSASEVKALNLEGHLAECKFAKEQQMGNAKSKRVAVSAVNSGYNDYSPILIENGKTLYFTSRRNDTKGGSMNPDDQEFFEDTYRAVWNAEITNWDSISNDLGRINTEGFDAINYISKDGNHGLMTVNTTATEMKNTTKGSDLFTIEMSNKGKWSTPKRISAKTINTSFFEGSATMTNDMNTMYFVSDRKGEKSSTDIYVSQKVGKNWGEAKPLPFSINTIGRETTPFITGDGRFLFFSSDGHLGMGGLDIYVVENLGSTWSDPINLGILVNTVNNDTHFQYYPELQKAVMASFEIIGQKASMDIFNVDMTDFIYPKGK
jgi:tetratricopeptide (TPR) repeat protein